jgi:hypothetical protein
MFPCVTLHHACHAQQSTVNSNKIYTKKSKTLIVMIYNKYYYINNKKYFTNLFGDINSGIVFYKSLILV